MDIRPFRTSDLEAAAALFAARYAEQRRVVPLLPDTLEDAQRVTPLLEDLVADGPALVAVDGDEMIGYLAGWLISEVGEPWVYVPEWGHGAAGPARRRAWEHLYATLLPRWLDKGAYRHCVSLLADDRDLADALSWLSFGAMSVDAIRGTHAVGSDPYPVRRATPADIDAVVALREGLRQHLRSTPTYLVLPKPIAPAAEHAMLEDAAVATFLSELDGEIVGFLRIGPSADDVARVVRDAGTASITGAFIVANRRGAGIGGCLLDHALAWARAQGYVRVGVDFEPMNVLAARFWTAEFTPVVITMSRTIDPRVMAAADERLG
jgi:GNAT superfamily N-acetyltransferase